MMVGAYRSPGNTAPTMEWNAGVDPEALAATIAGWAATHAPRPMAFGLDVTEKAKMTPDHLARLATIAGEWAVSIRTAGHGELLYFTVSEAGAINAEQPSGRPWWQRRQRWIRPRARRSR